MANFLYLERRMISRERLRATSSAVKILALLEMRKLLETFRPTAAAAQRLFILDPYVCVYADSLEDPHIFPEINYEIYQGLYLTC